MASYTSEFREHLKRLPKRRYASEAQWVEHEVTPTGLFDKTRMYKPLILPVRTTQKRGNFTAIRVTPWRQGWWEVVQKGMAETLGLRDYRRVDLRDIYGNSLRSMPVEEMARVNEVEVFDDQDQILVRNAPVPAGAIHPLKDDILEQFWGDTSNELASVTAEVLQGTPTKQELIEKLSVEDHARGTPAGALEKAFRKTLAKDVNAAFVHDFAENDESASLAPEELIKDVARMAMAGVRSSMAHSSSIVDNCLGNHYVGDDLFAAPGSNGAAKIDEFREYKRIGHYGLNYGNLGRNVVYVIRHGDPHRRHHRMHPHLGPHHHPLSHAHHVHKTTTTTTTSHRKVLRPVVLRPFARPSRNMPHWWYQAGPHKFYTSGGGAHHHERTVVTKVYKSPVNGQVPNAYRGDEKRAVDNYHRFAGRAPCPTPSFMRAQQAIESKAGLADLTDSAKGGEYLGEDVRSGLIADLKSEPVGNWFKKQRAKYRASRLKNARKRLEKAKSETMQTFWAKRVEYWENKVSEDTDIEEMVQQAINEDIAAGIQPIESMAQATWLIGCSACKSRDAAYYRMKADKYRMKLEKARSRGDMEDIEEYSRKVAKYEAMLADTDSYRMSGMSVMSAMERPRDAYDRLVAIEEAIIHGASEFFEDADEVDLAATENTIGERIVDTMAKYLFKYANEEGAGEALHVARELADEAPQGLPSQMWTRVLNIAEDQLMPGPVTGDEGLMGQLYAIFAENDESTREAGEVLQALAADGNDDGVLTTVTQYLDDNSYSDDQKDAMQQWLIAARKAQRSGTRAQLAAERRFRRRQKTLNRSAYLLSLAKRKERMAKRRRRRAWARYRRRYAKSAVPAADAMPVGYSYEERMQMRQRAADLRQAERGARGDDAKVQAYRMQADALEEAVERDEKKHNDKSRWKSRIPEMSPMQRDTMAMYNRKAETAMANGNTEAARYARRMADETRREADLPPVFPQIGSMVKDSDAVPVFEPQGKAVSARVGDSVLRLVDRSKRGPDSKRVAETARGLLNDQAVTGKNAREVATRRMVAARVGGDISSAEFYEAVVDALPAQAPVPSSSNFKEVGEPMILSEILPEEEKVAARPSGVMTFAELMAVAKGNK